jgi:hypothetical protein
MSNPWLTHVMNWRKQYGEGLTYKQVLIEARKSYTPVKQGGGYQAKSTTVRPPPPSAADQAATRARVMGGALTARELKRTLNASYDDVPMDATNDFKVDTELSGKRTKIFHDDATGRTVVAHRGTASIQDVGTDLGLAVGFRGKRFKHAKKVQKQAEAKYGTENLDTVGHSLAGVIAEEVGGNSRNGITMNKAVVNPNRRNLKNQTDIKTSNDPVSALNRFSNNKAHVIPSQKFNPLKPFKEHTVTTLKRVKKDKQYGR